MENKTRRLNIRLSEETYDHFTALSEYLKKPKSEMIRKWIEDAYADLKLPGEFLKPTLYPAGHKITPEEATREHKRFWSDWPYFDEPRKVWTDDNGNLCIEYVDKNDLSTHFYRYSIENNNIVWG